MKLHVRYRLGVRSGPSMSLFTHTETAGDIGFTRRLFIGALALAGRGADNSRFDRLAGMVAVVTCAVLSDQSCILFAPPTS